MVATQCPRCGNVTDVTPDYPYCKTCGLPFTFNQQPQLYQTPQQDNSIGQVAEEDISDRTDNVADEEVDNVSGSNLVMCEDCGHLVSKNAKSCPNCGAKTKKKGAGIKSKKTIGILVAAIATISVLILVAFAMAGHSDEINKADELYEQGSYQAALDIYEQIKNPSSKIIEKKNDCKFWLYVEYLRNQSRASSNNPSGSDTFKTTITYEAQKDGTLVLNQTHESSYSGSAKTNYRITIPYKGKEAEIQGSLSVKVYGASLEQSGRGYINISTYQYGDSVELSETNNNASINSKRDYSFKSDELTDASDTVKSLIRGLGESMEKSGTGCTLEIIGFNNI